VLIEASLVMSPRAATAQDYPAKQITLVVAFAPAGSADSVTRIVVDRLSARLGGVSIVVENRGGAGGNLAAKQVAAATADGYTVLVTTTAVAINETLYKNKGYATEDLRPVAIAASFPEVLACSVSNPAKDLQDFLRALKDKGISYSSAGVGTPSLIQAEYFFKTLAQIKAVHVPFAGDAPAVAAYGKPRRSRRLRAADRFPVHQSRQAEGLGGGEPRPRRGRALSADLRGGRISRLPCADLGGFFGAVKDR